MWPVNQRKLLQNLTLLPCALTLKLKNCRVDPCNVWACSQSHHGQGPNESVAGGAQALPAYWPAWPRAGPFRGHRGRSFSPQLSILFDRATSENTNSAPSLWLLEDSSLADPLQSPMSCKLKLCCCHGEKARHCCDSGPSSRSIIRDVATKGAWSLPCSLGVVLGSQGPRCRCSLCAHPAHVSQALLSRPRWAAQEGQDQALPCARHVRWANQAHSLPAMCIGGRSFP